MQDNEDFINEFLEENSELMDDLAGTSKCASCFNVAELFYCPNCELKFCSCSFWKNVGYCIHCVEEVIENE